MGWNWGPRVKSLKHLPDNWHLLGQYIYETIFFHTILLTSVGIVALGTAQDPAITFGKRLTILPESVQPVAASWILTVAVGFAIWGSISLPVALSSLLAVIGCIITGQQFDPRLYPMPFTEPLSTSSLRDLWSRRWHAVHKRGLKIIGYEPCRQMTSWMGNDVSQLLALTSAFFISGAMHVLCITVSTFGMPDRYVSPSIASPTLMFFTSQALFISLESKVFVGDWKSYNRPWMWFILVSMARHMAMEWLGRGMIGGIAIPQEWTWKRILIPMMVTVPQYII